LGERAKGDPGAHLLRSAAALAVILSFAVIGASEARPVVGAKAPRFGGTTVEGKAISLDDFHGDVVIVNFWATWCAPCRVELPLLDGYSRAREKNGLRVLAVTMDAGRVPLSAIRSVRERLSLPLLTQFRGDYGPIKNAISTNYVIDRAGIVRYAKEGKFDLEKLNAILVPLLNEPAPADSPSTAGR
jgi:cytochrome c biogenesis protein CcmG, thiol:disulfide interchange protein DsbE